MANWRKQDRKCECGEMFIPKREKQAYCSKRCANAATKQRRRSGDMTPPLTMTPRSGDTPPTPHPDASEGGSTMVWPEDRARHPEHGSNPDGSTPGALQGDDYPLTYDENGYPELPPCLDRRPKPKWAVAA
jgi:hypothetical protein